MIKNSKKGLSEHIISSNNFETGYQCHFVQVTVTTELKGVNFCPYILLTEHADLICSKTDFIGNTYRNEEGIFILEVYLRDLCINGKTIINMPYNTTILVVQRITHNSKRGSRLECWSDKGC